MTHSLGSTVTLLVLFALACALVPRAAATIYVDANSTCTTSCGSAESPYATIGEALRDTNNNNGEIVVRSGTYTGTNNYNLTVGSSNVVLRSESGDPATTVINCARQGPGLIVSSSTFTMQGFTIRNCEAENGGGMHISSTYTVLRNIKFIGNHATKNGGSLWIKSNAVEAYNSTISASTSDNYGGGVYIESANLKLFGSHVEYNSADEAGNQLYCQSAAVQIDRESTIDRAVSAECDRCSITYMNGGGTLSCSPAGSRVGGSSALLAAIHGLVASLW